MKRVVRWETGDGCIFEQEFQAHHHANQRYGNALIALSHKLVQIEKYSKMSTFVDENLSEFVQLKRLKDDIVVENEECDEEN